MKDNLTFIAVVLDKSTSMGSVREATIAAFNRLLADQKAAPGEALLTLAVFSSFGSYAVPIDARPLPEVPNLTRETYVPSGNTALIDAIGETIDRVGAKLAAMPEQDRPARVIVVVQTDGEENASQKYTARQVAEMVKHQREVYSWEFLFIGAEEASVLFAQSMNFAAQNVAQYTSTDAGTHEALNVVSASLRSYRSGGSARIIKP